MSTLKIENLTKSYTKTDSNNKGNRGNKESRDNCTKELKVLDNLSFIADTSKITVILGQSGCGKTTLLRLISGLEEKNSGSIAMDKEIHLGMVFQEARLMPWLSTKENICFGLSAKDKENIDHTTVQKLIAAVGLTGFEEAYPKALSGGMQQRVALARALITQSNLLLMDEPFAALDYFTRRKMQLELLRISKTTNTGIMLVTHNIDEALTLADKILVMQEGKIILTTDLPANENRDILSPDFIQYKRDILGALELK